MVDFPLKNLKYCVSLIPKSKELNLEGSLEKISKVELKRGRSFFNFTIFYKTDEFYNLKYYFKNGFYVKSYLFKKGNEEFNKNKILVNDFKEIKELNSFVTKYFDEFLDDDFKLIKNSFISLNELKSDLKSILNEIY